MTTYALDEISSAARERVALDGYVESILTGKALAAFRVAVGDEREILRRKSLSQWMTQDELAAKIVAWASVSGYVLEPSCGTGAFVRACVGSTVTSLDIDTRFAATAHRDYLQTSFSRQFDWVVMNPPYEKSLDMLFLEKAAADARNVVALVRLNALAGAKRYERVWKHVNIAGVVVLSSRPSFDLVDMPTDSPQHDFCVVHYTMDDVPQRPMEFWP